MMICPEKKEQTLQISNGVGESPWSLGILNLIWESNLFFFFTLDEFPPKIHMETNGPTL